MKAFLGIVVPFAFVSVTFMAAELSGSVRKGDMFILAMSGGVDVETDLKAEPEGRGVSDDGIEAVLAHLGGYGFD